MGFDKWDIFKDVSRGFEHQKHELKYHDADMRKKGWWNQHSLRGFAGSVGSFVEGVTGGEGLATADVKETRDFEKHGIKPYQDWTIESSNQSTRGVHMK